MGRGQACLARLGGAWLDVRVTAVHPGGTVSVVEAGRETAFMADWHSVSACDLAVDDAARWTALVAPHLAADGTLGVEDVEALPAGVGTTTTAEGLAAWWGEGAAGPGRRTAEDVHRLLRGAGGCAKQLDPRVTASLLAQVEFPRRFGDLTEFASLAAYLCENAYFNAECVRLDAGTRVRPR